MISTAVLKAATRWLRSVLQMKYQNSNLQMAGAAVMDQETKTKSRHEVIIAKVPWSAGLASASQCGELLLMVTSEGELQPKAPTLTPHTQGKSPQHTHRFSRSSTVSERSSRFVRQVFSSKGVSRDTLHGCSQRLALT